MKKGWKRVEKEREGVGLKSSRMFRAWETMDR